MRSSEKISAATKPFFDRVSDSLKVSGSGNAAGLVGLVAAMHTIAPDHTHTVVLLKPAALIFALGVLSFALAYLFFTYAFIYSEQYGAFLDQTDAGLATTHPAEGAKAASLQYMRRTAILGFGSAFCFFVGFVTTCTALIRY